MADSGNVTVFGDIADEFDALVTYNQHQLDNWVAQDGYSTGSMVLASTAMAFMTFAKGFVDVGRIGNGILVEGGLKGVGADVLRALNVAGGAGAIIGRGAKLLRMVQGTNLCAWFSHANASRLAGQRFFISVEQLAQSAGINLGQIAQQGGTFVNEYFQMATALKSLGVPVKLVSTGTNSLSNVLNIVKAYPRNVVTFGIEFVNAKTGVLAGHVLYATWSRLGGFAIRDPMSRTVIFRSLAELTAKFGQGAVAASAYPVFRIPNSLIMNLANAAQTLAGGSILSALALQLLPVIKVSASDGETALQTLMVHEQATSEDSRPVPKAHQRRASLTGKHHTVVAGDWLSKLAKHYYGDAQKWPVIYAANSRTIGKDPDLIKPGQNLLIADLPHCRIIAAAAVPGSVMVA